MKSIPNSETNENILYETKLHWISNILPIIMMVLGVIGLPFAILVLLGKIGGIITMLSLGLSFLFFKGLYTFLLNKSFKVTISRNKITLNQGVFSRQISDISIKKFEGLHFHQTFLGRLLGFGYMHLSTGGFSQSYVIENPQEFRNKVLTQISLQ